MLILIDKKRAVLKKGTSFDFISENRFFTGADSYTLSITFPLKDCANNLAIFGHINRKDNDLDTLLLDCEIHDHGFHKYGSVSVVEISETEVKTQFLEGRSARNFYSSFDDVYINEIPMGEVHDFGHWNLEYYVRSYDKWRQNSEEDGLGEYEGYVCLPWVNNTSGNMQNKMIATSSQGHYYYAYGGRDEDPPIVGMPYLFVVIKKIFKHLGYSYDFSTVERTQWRNIIICNVLPMVWQIRDMQAVLPHWTVSEFLEQVELFLDGEFLVDEKARTVEFAFNSAVLDEVQVVEIRDVVDEHSVEISDAEDTRDDYFEQKNIQYAECDHQMWKFYSCQWAVNKLPKVSWANYATMKNALDSYLICDGPYTHYYYRYVHYCRSEATYFVLKCYQTGKSPDKKQIRHYMRIQPVNPFGPRIVSRKEDAEMQELRIVPACIDHTDNTNGDMLFVECGTLGDDTEDAEDKDENQTQAVNTISAGEKEKKEEYFDKLYVGFWDGDLSRYWPQMPFPIADACMVKQDNTLMHTHYTMRLSGSEVPETRTSKFNIDQSRKFTFKFLCKDGKLPDVRSVFLIRGKKYLAEKMTATFAAETGMSQLVKLQCYRLR